MPFKYADLCERIIANTVLAPDCFFNGSPCWWWVGARHGGASDGRYGKFSMRLKLRKKGERHRRIKYRHAHRVSIEAFSTTKLGGRYGLHLCPPHPNRTLCCNPEHLRGGSPSANQKQRYLEALHCAALTGLADDLGDLLVEALPPKPEVPLRLAMAAEDILYFDTDFGTSMFNMEFIDDLHTLLHT